MKKSTEDLLRRLKSLDTAPEMTSVEADEVFKSAPTSADVLPLESIPEWMDVDLEAKSITYPAASNDEVTMEMLKAAWADAVWTSLRDEATKHDYPRAEREAMAKSGEALPDGSFPIKDQDDLEDDLRVFAQAADQEAVKAHIIKRATELGLTELLPEDWGVDKSKEPNDQGQTGDPVDEAKKLTRSHQQSVQQVHDIVKSMGANCANDNDGDEKHLTEIAAREDALKALDAEIAQRESTLADLVAKAAEAEGKLVEKTKKLEEPGDDPLKDREKVRLPDRLNVESKSLREKFAPKQ